MTPLIKRAAGPNNKNVTPFNFPVERLTENILALSDSAVVITNGETIDFCTQSIVSVLGINRETVITKGWPALIELIHPADIRLLEKKVFPEIRNHFKNLTDSERRRRTFNFTVRMHMDKNPYSMIAIENRPLQWIRKDWPSVYITILRDITPFGNKDEMTLNIDQHNENKSYESVFHRHYSFASDKFSARETEIIRYIAKGMTSNQIAEALFLSAETVRNHRKNIMRKAGCTFSAALTRVALKEGII